MTTRIARQNQQAKPTAYDVGTMEMKDEISIKGSSNSGCTQWMCGKGDDSYGKDGGIKERLPTTCRQEPGTRRYRVFQAWTLCAYGS